MSNARKDVVERVVRVAGQRSDAAGLVEREGLVGAEAGERLGRVSEKVAAALELSKGDACDQRPKSQPGGIDVRDPGWSVGSRAWQR